MSGSTQAAQNLPGGGWRLEVLKVAVSAVLVWLILRRFSYAELRAHIVATDALALLVPFAIIVSSNLLGAVQWSWILRSRGLGIGFGRLLRAYWIGLFLNNFLLGSVGGDVYKVYSLGREAGQLGRVAGATIVDRMVALAALCTLALVAAAAALRSTHVPAGLAVLTLGTSLAIVLGAGVLLHERLGEALTRWVERWPLGRFGQRLARLLGHLRDFRRKPAVLNGAFLISLTIQASRVLAHYFVGQAMGWGLQPAELAKFFVVIPILGLLIALPISIGGWGVREWAGVALFAPMGHGGEEAVTLLALTALLTLASSLLGAAAMLVPGRAAAAAAA